MTGKRTHGGIPAAGHAIRVGGRKLTGNFTGPGLPAAVTRHVRDPGRGGGPLMISSVSVSATW